MGADAGRPLSTTPQNRAASLPVSFLALLRRPVRQTICFGCSSRDILSQFPPGRPGGLLLNPVVFLHPVHPFQPWSVLTAGTRLEVTSGHCFQSSFWPRSILAELDTSAPTRPIPAAPASGSAMGGNGDLPLNCGERMRSGLNCDGGCSAHCGFFHTGLVRTAPASPLIRDGASFFSGMTTSPFYRYGAFDALRLTSSRACPTT